MIKDAIGILDMGLESFNILSTLNQLFKHERFIYINDLKNQPYEGKKEEDILDCVKKNVERLMAENIKLLIVTSDIIIEYCSDYLENLNIPYINLVTSLIDFVNENYEQKNIVLLAKNSILEANLYQKNFKYNHLYNIASNELEEIINSKLIKTSKSFHTTKETFKNVLKKDIDIIVTSSPYLYNLKTEIFEYIKGGEITNIGEIVACKISSLCKLNTKGRGKVIVYSNILKKEFRERTYWSDIKYKLFEFDIQINKKKKVFGNVIG